MYRVLVEPRQPEIEPSKQNINVKETKMTKIRIMSQMSEFDPLRAKYD